MDEQKDYQMSGKYEHRFFSTPKQILLIEMYKKFKDVITEKCNTAANYMKHSYNGTPSFPYQMCVIVL